MVSKATDSLRDKTADALDKVEETVRGAEEKKEPPKAERKKAKRNRSALLVLG